MKKYFLALLVISLIVFTSGCTSNSNQDTNATKTISQNNISFTYPGTWVLGNSPVNDTIAAVADPNSVNGTGYAETVVTVQVKNLTGTMDAMYQQNYATFFNNSSYQRVSESNLTLADMQALENVYTVDYKNGVQKQQRAVWIQKDDKVYVILCSALVDQYEKEKANFDLIVNTFKFT